MEQDIAFVIATKDRKEELESLLQSLAKQTFPVSQIVIVDGGENTVANIPKQFRNLNIKYLQHYPPSAAGQRNVGIDSVDEDINFIGFMDDDCVLEPDAMEKMMEFWEQTTRNLGGASFNLANHPEMFAPNLKSMSITERLGLYSKKKGDVLPSGFHTMIGFVDYPVYPDWLPSTAVVWRREIFDRYHFDEWYSGYSYLEDLDFSYSVGLEYDLAVVPGAKYYHYHASGGRLKPFIFGKREALNRIYFVKKHKELVLFKCYLALFVRMMISITQAVKSWQFSFLKRAAGNWAGLTLSLFPKTREKNE